MYAAVMPPCEGCAGQADFTAVSATHLGELRASVRDLGWGMLGLWAAVVLIAWALLRKGILAPGDLLPGLSGG